MTTQTETQFLGDRTRGTGSIFTRPGSKFLYIQYYSFGKVRQESCKSDKLAVAERMLRNRLADADKGILPISHLKKIVYADAKKLLLDDYANHKYKSLQTLADGTVKIWGIEHLDDFFGGHKLLSITSARLQDFVEKRQKDGAENGTINRNLSLLRRMLNLVAERHAEYRVPHFPHLKENDPRKGFLGYEDFCTLRASLPASLHRLVTLCYETGVRLGEATSIRWEQVDVKKQLVTLDESQTKSGEPRTIPLSDELCDMLKTQFRTGMPFPATNLTKAWKKARTAAKLTGLLFHDLRRSAISNYTAAGVAPPVVMSISGHKTTNVFLRYNIAQPKVQQDALRKVVDARKAPQ